ncbi:hypothetical protein ACFL9T_20070 [Thermodesulfobacteriota bacterium]
MYQIVIVCSSDFSEAGPEGAVLEREVVALARRHGIRIIGPNTMGVFGAKTNFHGIIVTIGPLYGSTSMFSQSGNFGVQMMMRGIEEGLGFNKFVSSGNEGDLNCIDYLRYFGDDKSSRTIVGYLEGVDAGSEFLAVAKKISREKPVIILKSGRTESGIRAATSHTGAIAGSLDSYEAAFRQSGIIQVSTIQEIVDCAKVFSEFPLPKGKRVAILTRGGGWGVMTADFCHESGLEVPLLPDKIIKKINKILPRYWSRGNPVDMVGITEFEPFLECLEIMACWDGADAIIALAGMTGSWWKFDEKEELLERARIDRDILAKVEAAAEEQEGRTSALARQLITETGKPILFVDVAFREAQLRSIQELRAISYSEPERAVGALKRMVDYKSYLDSL